ncbi:hypothetical protein KGF54_001850 [Candida jiufengensis]|uniref:uncharacterized protein n=1 Tax=Candida jiufengensis TaxID=497108 RepID=UPI002224D41B|nr:uncharacterized protein KGF54_001850 [Candida jiufengensis]KAI5955289.1 hypothetical protein KGF54_001850 [Candida jiufengensis]
MNSSPGSDKMSYNTSNSSPISSMSILDSINYEQQKRNRTRLNPLSSSPVQSPTHYQPTHYKNSHSHNTSNYYNRLSPTRPLNLRNKHNKIRQVRDQHRHDKLIEKRDKTNDQQLQSDEKIEHNIQIDEFLNNRSIDDLIADEEEEYRISRNELEEAEYRAWQEEMELIDLINSMDVNDKT